MKNTSHVKFGKVLKFTSQNEENNSVEFACMQIFSLMTEDKENGGSTQKDSLKNVCQCVKSLSHL